MRAPKPRAPFTPERPISPDCSAPRACSRSGRCSPSSGGADVRQRPEAPGGGRPVLRPAVRDRQCERLRTLQARAPPDHSPRTRPRTPPAEHVVDEAREVCVVPTSARGREVTEAPTPRRTVPRRPSPPKRKPVGHSYELITGARPGRAGSALNGTPRRTRTLPRADTCFLRSRPGRCGRRWVQGRATTAIRSRSP